MAHFFMHVTNIYNEKNDLIGAHQKRKRQRQTKARAYTSRSIHIYLRACTTRLYTTEKYYNNSIIFLNFILRLITIMVLFLCNFWEGNAYLKEREERDYSRTLHENLGFCRNCGSHWKIKTLPRVCEAHLEKLSIWRMDSTLVLHIFFSSSFPSLWHLFFLSHTCKKLIKIKL